MSILIESGRCARPKGRKVRAPWWAPGVNPGDVAQYTPHHGECHREQSALRGDGERVG